MSQETMHVLAGFKTEQGAKFAADQLTQQGLPREAIGLLMSERAQKRLMTIEKHTKAPEGVAVGGIAGGAVGGLFAGLTSVAAVALPGLGLLAAGPLVSVFAGVGAGAAAGGVLGGVVGLGVRDHEAKLYDQVLKEDGVLVAVSTEDKRTCQLVAKIFEECGAIRITTTTGATARISGPQAPLAMK